MRLRVFPQYGFGWYSKDGTSLEVPPEFEMGSALTGDDKSFSLALGQVLTEGHPLHSLWVLLTQRTDGGDPTYNLHAYEDRPGIPDRGSPVPEASVLTGFATIVMNGGSGALRICCDFNERMPDGACWNLNYGHAPLEERIAEFGLKEGSKVVLYPDEEDFEVTAVLSREYSDLHGREVWLARADWGTIKRYV